MNWVLRAVGVVAVALVPACREPTRTVVLTSEKEPGIQLTYRCDSFAPQAKSAADLRVVFQNLGPTLRELKASDDIAGLVSLGQAAQAQNIRSVEEGIVQHRCARPASTPAP